MSKTSLFAAAFIAPFAFGALSNAALADASTPGIGALNVASIPASYKLAVGDTLDISVMGHDDLKSSVTILPDGSFNFPIAGHIGAQGLTVAQLTAALTHRLSDQLNQPSVTIVVRSSAPQQVSILGAVRSPGLYSVKPGWRLMEAFAACGGASQDNSLTQATLIRDNGKTSVPINVEKLMQGQDDTLNLPLQPGDVLLVQQRDPSVAQVQVSGHVLHPGSYSVPAGGGTITSLLAQAGGPTDDAALAQAQVMHNGEVRTVNLRPLLSSLSDSAASPRLVPGDVLLIPENKLRFAVLGEVAAPRAYAYPDDQGVTVSDALATAGGPTGEANKREANILRKGSDGKVTTIKVNLDEVLAAKPGTTNVALQPDDILYVPTKGHPPLGIRDFAVLIPALSLFVRR
ncbi:SLBB domain-containing protein [Capsulimonas corticalis]|uniref:SLBB domain-containing protein n=1 Tax=Capsulimonas corticalis TaxID=2219043 RepID=UPI00263A3355|nr:SLBB domain-containing protein [Capsulimonas corticalis]